MSEITEKSPEEKQKERAERKRQREISDIKSVIKLPEGRRMFWRVMARSGIFKMSYTGEINSTMFNEGRRDIGNWLFSELFEANPNAFTQMSQENDSELESEKNTDEQERKSDPTTLI